MYCLWRAESVAILVAVLNQLLDPKGPQAAGWYDHRFGGRGVIGTPVGAYATGGGRRGVNRTLVIVVETPEGSRQEVHWRDVPEVNALAHWLSLILRIVAAKHIAEDVVPYDIHKAWGVIDTLFRHKRRGSKLYHIDLPRYIDRCNAKMFYHHHQPLIVDSKPVPTIR